MSFAKQINALLASGNEAAAVREINATEDPGLLYELVQGLDPTLAGSSRIAAAACSKLRELAKNAEDLFRAQLNDMADIAKADADAIRRWFKAGDAAKKAKTARALANQLEVTANLDSNNPDAHSDWQSAETQAQMAEVASQDANDKARDSITFANGLRTTAHVNPLALELPADPPVAPAAGPTPKVKFK